VTDWTNQVIANGLQNYNPTHFVTPNPKIPLQKN